MPTVVAISAAFWFKRLCDLHHGHVHGPQHVGQHMVGLDLQMVRFQLDRDMAVAQVVRRASQVERAAVLGAGGDAQHGLRRRLHTDQRTVFGHQHIAAAHHGASGQEDAQLALAAVHRVKAAFLAGVPVQCDGAGPLDQHAGQATALGHEFGTSDHQNKK